MRNSNSQRIGTRPEDRPPADLLPREFNKRGQPQRDPPGMAIRWNCDLPSTLTTPAWTKGARHPAHGAKDAKAVDPVNNYARPLCHPAPPFDA